jgi:hypothetical protein
MVCDAVIVQAWQPDAKMDLAGMVGLRAVLDARSALDRNVIEGAGITYLAIGA